VAALDRADVGQAAGGEGPGRAKLVGGARRQRIAATQRRIVEAVPQWDDAAGVEEATAGSCL
jgi:hypothetical protein